MNTKKAIPGNRKSQCLCSFPSPALTEQVQWVEGQFLPLSPNNELPYLFYCIIQMQRIQAMKRAIIFYNGDLSDLSQAKKYIQSTDFIICADGGTEYAFKLGLKPNVVIGDFDSSSQDLQKKIKEQLIPTIKYKTDKDETDSELAINYAIEKGYDTLFIFGLLGTGLDHLLTNIFYLANLAEKNVDIDITIIEGKQEIKVTNTTIKLKGKIGDRISLIPLKGDVKEVNAHGLEYEDKLVNADLRFGYSFGLSDSLIDGTAEISLKNGTLLVIHEKS